MAESDKPVTKRLGHRRVRTEPVKGQGPEPEPEKKPEDSDESARDRLTKDKPPHY
jgi:hypothetical protein